MENAKRVYVTVSVDFEVDAWEFWEAVEKSVVVQRLCPEMRSLLAGDHEKVKIRLEHAEFAIYMLSTVKGWKTGDKKCPFPLRFQVVG